MLFLFAESYLGIYVIGGMTLLFLAYSNKIDLSRFFKYKVEFFLGSLFFACLVVASFFTHAPALSLNSLIFFGFSLIFFSFFMLLDKKYLQTELIFPNILVVVFSLALLSLFFSIFPKISEVLPEMNLIHATYGHNHFGTVAIMTLPVVWYFIFYYRRYRKKQLPYLILMALLMVNLALSFGRVAMAIGFVQFAFFAVKYLFFKKISTLGSKITIIILSLMAVFAFVFVNYYSFAKLMGLNATCLWPDWKNQICKDIQSDQRTQYFKTAMKATKENLLFGYGPGSYALINEKYKSRPDISTSFAHNFILQLSAESGLVVASAFVLFIGFLLLKSLKIVFVGRKNDEQGINSYLLLGVISLIGVSLLDFDLSYLSLHSLMLLFFAYIFNSIQTKSEINKKNSWLKLVFNFACSIFILLSILSIVVQYFLITGQQNKAARLFPYFQSDMKIFLDNTKDLDSTSRQNLARIYDNYLYTYLHGDEIGGFIKNKEKITEISPWTIYSPSLLRKLAESNQELAVQEVINLFDKYKKLDEVGYRSTPNVDYEIATFAMSLADKYLSEGKTDEAAKFYKMAHVFYQWIFVESFPRFLYQFERDEQRIDFWSRMTEIESQYFAKHMAQVGLDHRSLLIDSLKKNDLEMSQKWFHRIMELDSGLVAKMEYLELPLVQKMADHFIEAGDWPSAERAVKLIYEIGSHEGREQLGNYYLMRGQIDEAKAAYKACLDGWRDEVHFECDLMLKSELVQTDKPYLLASQKIKVKN